MSESPRVINPAALLLRSAMSDFEMPLTKYAVSILGDLEQARDVVQDTFLKLYKQDPEKVRKKVKSWLFTVCRNHCYDLRMVARVDVESQPLPVHWPAHNAHHSP